MSRDPPADPRATAGFGAVWLDAAAGPAPRAASNRWPRARDSGTNRGVAALAYVVCALVWGTTWYAIRVCIGPGGYPSFLSAALRFTIAAAILGAALALGIGKPRPRGN